VCESEKTTNESENANEDEKSWYAWAYEGSESENDHESEVVQDVAQAPSEIMAEAGEMLHVLGDHAEKNERRVMCEMKVLPQDPWVSLGLEPGGRLVRHPFVHLDGNTRIPQEHGRCGP
jgi:hypothetical protein